MKYLVVLLEHLFNDSIPSINSPFGKIDLDRQRFVEVYLKKNRERVEAERLMKQRKQKESRQAFLELMNEEMKKEVEGPVVKKKKRKKKKKKKKKGKAQLGKEKQRKEDVEKRKQAAETMKKGNEDAQRKEDENQKGVLLPTNFIYAESRKKMKELFEKERKMKEELDREKKRFGENIRRSPVEMKFNMEEQIMKLKSILMNAPEDNLQNIEMKNEKRREDEPEAKTKRIEESAQKNDGREIIEKLRTQLEKEKKEREKIQAKFTQLENELIDEKRRRKEKEDESHSLQKKIEEQSNEIEKYRKMVEDEQQEEAVEGEAINFKVKFTEYENIQNVPLNITDKKLVEKFLKSFGRVLTEDLSQNYVIKLQGNDVIKPRGKGKTLKLLLDEGEIQAGSELRAVLSKRE